MGPGRVWFPGLCLVPLLWGHLSDMGETVAAEQELGQTCVRHCCLSAFRGVGDITGKMQRHLVHH